MSSNSGRDYNNSFHLRTAVIERFNELSRLTGRPKTEMVNDAVERYVTEEMFKLAMGRAGIRKQDDPELEEFLRKVG